MIEVCERCKIDAQQAQPEIDEDDLYDLDAIIAEREGEGSTHYVGTPEHTALLKKIRASFNR
jgi:hypothetical protein